MQRRLAACIVVVIVAVLCAPMPCMGAPTPVARPFRVLTIHSGAEDFPSNPILDAGIREALASRPNVPVDYFAEYLEADVFPGREASLAFSEYLQRKYQGRSIDLVIAMTDSGLRFALDHGSVLFPQTPIVSFGVSLTNHVRAEGGGVTGIRISIAYAQTLKLALDLHPLTEHVFVVANGRDEQTVESVRAELRDFSEKVAIAYLTEKTIPGLLTAVKAVPSRSLIFYIWHSQQEPGNIVYPDQVAKLVAQVSPVPVYGTSDLYIGSGVVGGVMRGTRETGIRLGEMALRILTGTSARDMPIETVRVQPVLDWRQLRRWGISEARVPVGALIQFREPSVWDRYKVYILGAMIALLAQTALIAALLVQRAKRREAEEQVRGSYERIRDLGARLLNSQETERARIARELHDDIGQQMALMTIDLELLGGEPRQTDKLAGEALSRAQGIARSLHDLSHRLHPAKLRLIGLVPALQSLRPEVSKTEIAFAFTHDGVPSTLPPDLTLCLYRIVQEALQNAIKYSRAREVSVHLTCGPEGLALTIVDDGVGFDVKAAWGKGLGLISMRERLEAVGGTLQIRSNPGSGTRLEVRAPHHADQSVQTGAV